MKLLDLARELDRLICEGDGKLDDADVVLEDICVGDAPVVYEDVRISDVEVQDTEDGKRVVLHWTDEVAR